MGETLRLALMPLQPVPSSITPADIASNEKFEFNLTSTEYSFDEDARNI